MAGLKSKLSAYRGWQVSRDKYLCLVVLNLPGLLRVCSAPDIDQWMDRGNVQNLQLFFWCFTFQHMYVCLLSSCCGISKLVFQQDCMLCSKFQLLCAAQTRDTPPPPQKLLKTQTHLVLFPSSKCCLLSRFCLLVCSSAFR